ncbi:hypothetical protein B0H13DRAFT_1886221 [Mycena leptocephala]|nr:hypothetical protein B0H13DRAFT_1886221 [Mycena leptocephala]
MPSPPSPSCLLGTETGRLGYVWFGLGPTPQYILPLRESSTAFNAGLHRIAEEIPVEADESWVENKVRQLVQSTEEIVEIHQAGNSSPHAEHRRYYGVGYRKKLILP